MDTMHLKSFIEVCNQKSYSRAANVLHVSQPALSQQIKRLENDIGFNLFNHSTKSRIMLTEAGELFLEYAHSVIQEYDSIVNKCKYISNSKRIIRFAADFRDFSLIDKDFFEQYKRDNPSLDIKIKFENWANFLEMLYKNEVDIVFTSKPLNIKKHYRFIEVDKDKLAIVGNKNHPLFKKDKITLEDLKKQHISLPVDSMGEKVKEINDFLHKYYKEIQFEKPYTDVNYIDIQHTSTLYLAIESGKDYFINLNCKSIDTELYIPIGFLYNDLFEREVNEMVFLYNKIKK